MQVLMLTLQKLHAKVQRNLRAKPRKMYKLQGLLRSRTDHKKR